MRDSSALIFSREAWRSSSCCWPSTLRRVVCASWEVALEVVLHADHCLGRVEDAEEDDRAGPKASTRPVMLPSAPRLTNQQREDGSMFLIVAIALVVLWVMGAFVFRVLGGLVHILLIIALIALVVHFVRGHP